LDLIAQHSLHVQTAVVQTQLVTTGRIVLNHRCINVLMDSVLKTKTSVLVKQMDVLLIHLFYVNTVGFVFLMRLVVLIKQLQQRR
jgi:hypothetical protein